MSSTKDVSTHDASAINEYLKAVHSDEERMKFIEKITEGICTYCGSITDFCYCTWDD